MNCSNSSDRQSTWSRACTCCVEKGSAAEPTGFGEELSARHDVSDGDDGNRRGAAVLAQRKRVAIDEGHPLEPGVLGLSLVLGGVDAVAEVP